MSFIDNIRQDNVSIVCSVIIVVCLVLLVREWMMSKSGLSLGKKAGYLPQYSVYPGGNLRFNSVLSGTGQVGTNASGFLSGSPEPPVFYAEGDAALIAASQQSEARSSGFRAASDRDIALGVGALQK